MVSHACHREQQIRNRGLGDRCALEPRFGRLSRPGAARWRFPYQPPIRWNLVTLGCAQGRVKAAESVQILLKRGATFPAVRAIAIASHEHNHAQRCCLWLVTKIVLKPQILRNKRRDFASTCESRLNLTASRGRSVLRHRLSPRQQPSRPRGRRIPPEDRSRALLRPPRDRPVR